MKLTISKAAALLLTATTAFAGNSAASAAESNWSGAYAGIYSASNSGSYDYDGGGDWGLEGDSFGGFFGYRHDLGSFVLGGEVATTFQTSLAETDGYEDAFYFIQILDIKATVGYDLGRALVYATAGVSSATIYDYELIEPLDGSFAGVGIDYMVTDNFFVGGEYISHTKSNSDFLIDAELSSVQLRAGYRF